MTLKPPSTAEISDNILAQLQASLNQSVPLLPRSFLQVLSRAVAGVYVLLYKYAGFISLQTFVSAASLAETEINGRKLSPLKEWGRLIGIGDPSPATNAELTIRITVQNQSGALPAQSQLLNNNTGVTYITLVSVDLDAATKDITVRAVSDRAGTGGAGAAGNMLPGQPLNFANPLANVAAEATVIEQTVTGADGESEEAYRQRIIDRFQKRPQGGAYADYEQWGTEPPGILNIYPYTSVCPGEIDLYVEATPESSGNPDGIPTEAQLNEVLSSVNYDLNGLASRRPAGARVRAFPISRAEFTVTVLSLEVSDPVEVKADIAAAVEQYFSEREPYNVGLTVGARRDRIASAGIGGAIEDIVTDASGIFSGLRLQKEGIDISVYTLGIGEKAKLGTLIYE